MASVFGGLALNVLGSEICSELLLKVGKRLTGFLYSFHELNLAI